jgi:hypothetical protein
VDDVVAAAALREGDTGRGGGGGRKKSMVGPMFGGEIEGPQKWRVGGGIWRGLKNEGLFGGHAGVVFSPNL